MFYNMIDMSTWFYLLLWTLNVDTFELRYIIIGRTIFKIYLYNLYMAFSRSSREKMVQYLSSVRQK